MQIILQPLPSGSDIQLTGYRPSEGISGGVLSHSRLVEQIARIRAEAMQFRAHRNIAHVITFSITREHANEGVAGHYWLTHAQSLPDSCNVLFRVQRFSGATAAEVKLKEAIVLAEQGDWQGFATTFKYTISGGKFT